MILEDGDGLTRVMASRYAFGAPLSPISGRLEGEAVVLDAGEIRVERGGTLAWSELRVELRARVGAAAGSWQNVQGDVIDQSRWTASIAAALDTSGGSAGFLRPDTRLDGALLPSDSVEVRVDEPVSAASLAMVRIMADGAVVSGSPEVSGGVAGLASALRFTPASFLPFGAELTLDLQGLRDTSGNAITASAQTLSIPPDSGALTTNPSFESALTGWITSGLVSAESTYEGVVPTDGAQQVVVREQSSVAGYLDLPEDATELTLSVAVLSELGELDRDRSVVIALRSPEAGRTVVFDGFDHRESGVSGEYGEFGHLIGPLTASASLEPYRGQRVMLTIDVRSAFFIGVNYYAVIVDDVRVR